MTETRMRLRPQKIKKRHIFLVVLALEIITLPWWLEKVKNYEFPHLELMASAEIKNNTPGFSQFLVTSNGPFFVVADNLQGQLLTQVIRNGELHTVKFGADAHLPGAEMHCIDTADTQQKQIIYTANQGTYTEKVDDALDGTVLFAFMYERSTAPDIKFVTPKNLPDIATAKTCQA